MELVKSHNVNNVPTVFKLPNQRPCVFSHHNYTSQSALATPHDDHPHPDILYKGEVLEGIANLQCAGSTDLAEPWCNRQHTKAVPCISVSNVVISNQPRTSSCCCCCCCCFIESTNVRVETQFLQCTAWRRKYLFLKQNRTTLTVQWTNADNAVIAIE